jgi:altronate dehydratase
MSTAPTTTAVAIREDTPAHIIATVNNVAGACKAIVGASAMTIQGRAYIKVEGWQAIAAAHGCTASADTVTVIDHPPLD